VDYVEVVGTMNNWAGSGRMTSIGPFIYSVTYITDPGVVEYKFRINGDPLKTENLCQGGNRMTWAKPGTPFTVNHVFNDFQWNTWPVIFEVDMNAEIDAGNFDPANDFLDIAGTMNGWEGHSVLFDRDLTADGIYTINMLVDMYNPCIEFKFRINGDWETAEFPWIGPNRSWNVQDTSGGFVNNYECIYNITEVPYAPYVYNPKIIGNVLVGEEITGTYIYFDPNGDPEGVSHYKWYKASDSLFGDAALIDGAVNKNYLISNVDYGKYLLFEVTPVACTGEPNTGFSAYAFSGQVGFSNVSEMEKQSLQVFPNPASDVIHITSPDNLIMVYIYDITGQLIFSVKNTGLKDVNIQVADLKNGVYFIRCHHHEGKISCYKFMKF
jgi:hypothetical protein